MSDTSQETALPLSERIAELADHYPMDAAQELEQHPLDEQLLAIKLLPHAKAVSVFEYLPFTIQQDILNHLGSDYAASILNDLSPDDRTAFLEELSIEVSSKLLKYLSRDERAMAIKLLGYPEGSVGRLMTPDYLAVEPNWSVRKVMEFIRENGKDTETLNVIYVVDKEGKLIDDLRIRELLLAPLDSSVKDISDDKYVALSVYETEEDVVKTFRKYNRTALPVVNESEKILGIVTLDDILQVVEEVDTEDIQKIGGTSALDDPYMQISFFDLMKKRAGWLTLLFMGEMLTASAMGYFEEEISKAVVLALFLPLIISSGGNAGSQASTLVIRALALGEVTFKNAWQIIRREFFAGLFLGSILGIIGFLRIASWALFTDMYGPHWALIGFTVCFSLIGVVLWGSLSGVLFPLVLEKLGFDPAASSAPFVATMVDVTGVIIYFTLAILFLQGTLL
ncbi:MAG: magnesium transporter [Parachlamydiales bacterium]|jgi:magnesium transporter